MMCALCRPKIIIIILNQLFCHAESLSQLAISQMTNIYDYSGFLKKNFLANFQWFSFFKGTDLQASEIIRTQNSSASCM